MKHSHLLSVIIALLVGVVSGFIARTVTAPGVSLWPRSEEESFCTADAMLCPDGSFVGRSGPKCQFVCPPLPVVPADIQTEIDAKKDLIVVDTPPPMATISSPLTVTGIARGTWYFEGSFPAVVTDWDGLIIGEGVVKAESDWMTNEFVPFSGVINFRPTVTSGDLARGTLILKKDNPSGLPENDMALEIPIRFSPEASTQ